MLILVNMCENGEWKWIIKNCTTLARLWLKAQFCSTSIALPLHKKQLVSMACWDCRDCWHCWDCLALWLLISEDVMFALIRGPGSPWEVQLTASTAEACEMFVFPLLDPFRLGMTWKWVKLHVQLQVTTLPAIALRVARARAKARARCIIASWDFHAKTWSRVWIRLSLNALVVPSRFAKTCEA